MSLSFHIAARTRVPGRARVAAALENEGLQCVRFFPSARSEKTFKSSRETVHIKKANSKDGAAIEWVAFGGGACEVKKPEKDTIARPPRPAGRPSAQQPA